MVLFGGAIAAGDGGGEQHPRNKQTKKKLRFDTSAHEIYM